MAPKFYSTRLTRGSIGGRIKSALKAKRSKNAPRSTSTRSRAATRTRTATRVATQTKKKYYLVDDRAGSITDYVRNRKSNIPPTMFRVLKALQPMVYNRNDSFIYTSLAGFQEFGDLTYLSPANFAAMYGSSIAAATVNAATGVQSADIFVMQVKANLTFTNLSNGVLEFDLMDWSCRRDVYLDHTTLAASPRECFKQGLIDQSTTASSADYQKVGTTPFASKLFTMNYYVHRSRHIVLAPGQQHIHLVTIRPNCRMNEELITNANIYGFKGITCGTSILFRGPVVKDNASSVTYAPAEIGVIASYQYKHKFIPVNWRYQAIVNNLAATVGGANNFENLVKGAADAYATA